MFAPNFNLRRYSTEDLGEGAFAATMSPAHVNAANQLSDAAQKRWGPMDHAVDKGGHLCRNPN